MDNLETREDINKNVILIDLPDDYWEFVGNNLPDYHRRDEVLHSDIMEKFLDDELYDKDDLDGMGDMIDDYSGVDRILEVNKANVSVVVNKLNTELYIEALQARIEELESKLDKGNITVKRTGIINEFIVKVDNVKNPYESEEAFKNLTNTLNSFVGAAENPIYVLFGEQAVATYHNDNFEEVLKMDSFDFGIAKFNPRHDPLEVAEAMNGYFDFAVITSEQYESLKEIKEA